MYKLGLKRGLWLTLVISTFLSGCGGSDSASTSGPETELIDISAYCPTPSPATFSIVTADQSPILSKSEYVRATVKWSDTSGAIVDDTLSTRIRGRGNSTWDMPKKPYKLKLDEKTALLGLTAGKDWALLANYADKSLLRNEFAFCLARTLGLPYTPDSSMLEVTLNGQYDGLYQLTNKAYPIEDRIKAEATQNSIDGQDAGFNDAFVLELDWVLREDHWFHSVGGIPWNFASDTDTEQRGRIQAWINELETIILDSNDPDRYTKVQERVDLQSLADFFWVNEFTANPDAYLASTYAYRLRDGRLTFGPVWDFDQAQGLTDHNVNPEGWLFKKRSNSWYVEKLLEEPKFAELVRSRWNWLSERMPSFRKFIRDSAAALDASQKRNFERWPILDELVFTNVVKQGSYAGEINYMVDWTDQRAAWIDAHIDTLGKPTQ